jgi:hypothetical protein
MARPKGSLNKKTQPTQLDFEDKKFDEKTEVFMKDSDDLEQIQQELDLARVELEKTRLEIETKKHELKLIGNAPVVVKPAETPAITIKDNSLKEKIESQKKYDNEMVTGKFSNLRAPGQSVKLPYLKYADDPVKWHEFNHGQIYTIPRGFADQINGGTEENPCYYTPHFIKNDNPIIDPSVPESGIHAVDSSNKKYMFSPINF